MSQKKGGLANVTVFALRNNPGLKDFLCFKGDENSFFSFANFSMFIN